MQLLKEEETTHADFYFFKFIVSYLFVIYLSVPARDNLCYLSAVSKKFGLIQTSIFQGAE